MRRQYSGSELTLRNEG